MLKNLFGEKRGIEQYEKYLGARYKTFHYAFESFLTAGGRVVVELGTTRSFVGGDRPGTMVNDVRYWNPSRPRHWDWGAGVFTRMCAVHLKHVSPEIHSVDLSPEAIAISKVITQDFGSLVTHHESTSENFLSSFPKKIDLLYMDTGETSQEAEELHLREARIVVARELVSPGGVVIVDDVNVPGKSSSKGRLSIPFLSEHGFAVVLSDYQVVLKRSVKQA
jgi:hypothetical protein